MIPFDVNAIQAEFPLHSVHKGKDGMVCVNLSTINLAKESHAILTVIE